MSRQIELCECSVVCKCCRKSFACLSANHSVLADIQTRQRPHGGDSATDSNNSTRFGSFWWRILYATISMHKRCTSVVVLAPPAVGKNIDSAHAIVADVQARHRPVILDAISKRDNAHWLLANKLSKVVVADVQARHSRVFFEERLHTIEILFNAFVGQIHILNVLELCPLNTSPH